MVKRIGRWWRKKQRRADLDILWPQCKRYAADVRYARACFAFHVFRDRAWTADYSDRELSDLINRLD